MKPLVTVIMGSTSDLPVMQKACDFFEQMEIPFEVLALSAHRTPREVEEYAATAKERGIKVIIAAAGMAAHLGGIIAALTPLPVIGVPIRSTFDGLDSLLAIVQMPPGIPVATMAVNGALNAAVFASEILSVGDPVVAKKVEDYKASLSTKIVKANESLAELKYRFKTN